MKARVFFDDSLPLLAQTVSSELGEAMLSAGVTLRDISGRLAFFCPPGISEDAALRLERRLQEVLGPYADPDRAVVDPNTLGADAILKDGAARRLEVGGRALKLVDRRLVGADWLRTPASEAGPPARFVFASLKGGVGRSTAICVAAAHLATRGLRVLCVDLDLEAPGLGAMLLSDETLPQFGMVDALVENGLGGIDEAFVADLLGPSSLATLGGRIDVIPALGIRSRQNPADVLAKLARAYAEDIGSDGSVATVLDQVRTLVDRIAMPDRYDAVLIDSRAGLHEAGAAAVIGLGAEVFLFGRDEEQTFQGYSFLLAHLGRLLEHSAARPEWLERLTPVQALAPVDAAARGVFRQRWETMVRATGLLPALPGQDDIQLPVVFQDVPWVDDLPDERVLPEDASLLQPLAILRNSEYDGFDPVRRQDLLNRTLYDAVFRDLISRIDAAISTPSEAVQ